MTAVGEPRSRRAHVAALLGYLALTVALLWPAIRWFAQRPMVGTGDSSVFYWAWWAQPRALLDGNDPFVTDQLFFPVGADLALTTTTPLIAVATAPVRAVLGPAAQINLVQLGSFWLSAVGAYLLAVRLVHHRGAAFVAGVAFAMAPYRFFHQSDHLNLIHTGFLPFGVLALLRLLEVPSWRRAVALGAVVGAAFITDPHIAALTLTCLVPTVVAERARLLEQRRAVGLAVVVAVVIAAPLLVPALRATASGEGSAVDPDVMVLYSSDPVRWLLPPTDHPVLGAVSESIGGRHPDEGVAHPAWGMVALAVIGASSTWFATRRRWVALVAIGGILSLGPFLKIGDRVLDVPLPYRALVELPGIETMRAAGRFAIVAVLAIDVLAAVGIVTLLRRWGRERVILVGVLALVLFELWPPVPAHRSDDVPEPYEHIAASSNPGAVLELPLQWSTGEVIIGDTAPRGLDGRIPDHSIFMVYATVHEHPLVSGSVSRYPRDRLEELLAIPTFRQILALEGSPRFEDEPTFTARDLRDIGIGFVVYHRDRPVPDLLRHLESLDLPVLADDGTVVVWEVDG
jgi:hypothetical protein